jgi:hypothetical protein
LRNYEILCDLKILKIFAEIENLILDKFGPINIVKCRIIVFNIEKLAFKSTEMKVLDSVGTVARALTANILCVFLEQLGPQ